MANSNAFLNRILDEEFLGVLAKSANVDADPVRISVGLKVVPRAVMSMLISELEPMKKGEYKQIALPFGKKERLGVSKKDEGDFSFSLPSESGGVNLFHNRTIPGIGAFLLSKFNLFDLEDLNKSEFPCSEDAERKVQKLIDERMELHSLIEKVVENKMAEREAIHRLMMAKLKEALKPPAEPLGSGPQTPPSIPKPINIEASDIAKKEAPPKKGSPLKEFLEKKKRAKPSKEFHVEMSKSEQVNCNDCGQLIFGKSGYAACICLGSDMDSKLWIKKTENGIDIRFSKNWDPENINLLLETLRAKKC